MKPAAPAQDRMDKDPRPRHPLVDAEELLGTAPSPRVRKAVLAAAAQALAANGTASIPATRRSASGPWRQWAARVTSRPALPLALAMATGIFAVALSVQIAPEHPMDAGASVPAAPVASMPTTPLASSESAAGPSMKSVGKDAPAIPRTAPQPPEALTRREVGQQAVLAAMAPTTRSMQEPALPSSDAQTTMRARVPAAPSAPAAPVAMPPAALPAPVVQNQLKSPSQDAGAAPAPARLSADTTGDARALALPEAGAAPERADAPASAPASPGERLRHIIALRALHQDEAADRELADFVRRYPDIAVPPAARRH